MPNTKISNLPSALGLDDDLIMIEDCSGVTAKVTIGDITKVSAERTLSLEQRVSRLEAIVLQLTGGLDLDDNA